MASEQNPYASPNKVGQPLGLPRKYIGWFVGATLIGVVSGWAFKSGVELMIANVPLNPIRNVAIFAVAITVSAAVSLIGYSRQHRSTAKILAMVPRLVGGFSLGFVPYTFDRVIVGLPTSVGATIASLPTVLVISLSIAMGAVVSVAVEMGLRRCLRSLAKDSEATNHPLSWR